MKIYIFPALPIRSRHVKGINNWCSSLEGSSGYGLWNSDRKHESCSNAELIQTERNDAAKVTEMERPRRREVSNLPPALSPQLSVGEERLCLKGTVVVGPGSYKKQNELAHPFILGRKTLCDGQAFTWLCLTL